MPSPIDPPSGCRFRTRCPRLIQPPEFELTEEQWGDVREFHRSVQRRTFSLGRAEEDDLEPSTQEVEAEIDERFFPGGRPGGAVDEVIATICGHLADDEWEDAQALGAEHFEDASVCGREKPDYSVASEYGTGQADVACHLYRSE